MINLRYHIVSLTAVFLAIGIGLTLGSTFLDRATVDNLQGQLTNLEGRLDEREEQVNELQSQLDAAQATRDALDEQGLGLLSGVLTDVPVAIVASRGVDEDDVRGALQAVEAAGADVQGLFWLTDRWALDESAEVDDLTGELDEETTDPSRLRRMAVNLLGDELRDRQLLAEATDDPVTVDPGGEPGDGEDPATPDGGEAPADPEAPTDPPDTDAPGSGGPGVGAEGIEVLTGLIEIGFVDFEAVPGGPELPTLPPGTRLLLVGGSSEVPDDLVIEPLVGRMADGVVSPLLAVAGSARTEDGEISDLVAVIRESEDLREVLSTVDDLAHFDSWAAMVLAMRDVADGVVGHYGVGDGASRLLPPFPAT